METKNLEDITIENMLANIFTNTSIKKSRKDIVAYYRNILVGENLFSMPDGELEKRIDKVLKEDQKNDTPNLKYKDRKYYKAPKAGTNINPVKPISTNYLGAAGECSVMAELLFNGYNVNNLKVDEGIDLVACKANVFYYIQVKTTVVNQQNTFHFTVKDGNFMKFYETQMRYILVARAKTGKDVRNIYFQFNNRDIDILRSLGIIGPSSANNININIIYDAQVGKSFAYNGNKKSDVTYYMNNFNL